MTEKWECHSLISSDNVIQNRRMSYEPSLFVGTLTGFSSMVPRRGVKGRVRGLMNWIEVCWRVVTFWTELVVIVVSKGVEFLCSLRGMKFSSGCSGERKWFQVSKVFSSRFRFLLLEWAREFSIVSIVNALVVSFWIFFICCWNGRFVWRICCVR